MIQKKLILLDDIELNKLQPKVATLEDNLERIQKLLCVYNFYHLHTIKDMINKKRCFVISNKSECFCVVIFNAKFQSIMQISTDKNYLKKRLATKLLIYAIDKANINFLAIKAVLPSVPFWGKFGFVSTKKIYTTKKGKKLEEMIWFREKATEVQLE